MDSIGAILRDLNGDYIFECPRCRLEYTLPYSDRSFEFNYHCEVETCNYEILRPQRDNELEEQETLEFDRLYFASHQERGL